MAVKIDMDMPKKCEECRFAVPTTDYLHFCYAYTMPVLLPFVKTKPSWCPLKECE